jgi:hypothetical protein
LSHKGTIHGLSRTRSLATLAAQYLSDCFRASIGKGQRLELLQELTVLVARGASLMHVLLDVPFVLVKDSRHVTALFHSCCQPLCLNALKLLLGELDLKKGMIVRDGLHLLYQQILKWQSMLPASLPRSAEAALG